jgi:cell division protein FtsQ
MRKLINITIWTLFVIGVLLLLSFSYGKKKDKVCKDVKYDIDLLSGNHFVTPARLDGILKNIGFKVGEDKFEDIDTKKLEKKLLSLSSVEGVEVFKNMDGTLEISLEQRRPIARVFNRSGYTVYIDDKGKTMQVSDYYTARVLVINGHVNLKFGENVEAIAENDSLKGLTLIDELYELATYIENDKFLKAQIEQIYVEKNKEITLIPKVGNQEIIFGKVTEVEAKFKKLILFYTEGINPNNLNLYKTINLKFNNQIVCKKI